MFIFLYEFFRKKRVLFYFLLLLIFGVLAFLATKIKFEEDITKLLPTSEKSEKIKDILSTVKYSDKLIINIEGKEVEDLKEYAQKADSLLQGSCKKYIQKLQIKTEQEKVVDIIEFVQTNLPLFMENKDYQKIDSLLSPVEIEKKVEESYHSIISPSGWVTTQFIRQDPLGMTFLGLKKLQQFQTIDNFILDDGFVVSKDKKNLLIFITTQFPSSETNQNADFIKKLDEIINDLNTKFENKAKAEYFGAAAVAVANAKQIKSDIQITMSIAFLLLFALYIYFYRKIFVPLVVFIPAVFGSLLGISVLYLLRGTISAVSIGIGSVLLGITLDYSVHILSHYRSSGDINKLFKSITRPLLMCAIFTAVDFICLLFLHSDVLKDLGIFAGVSVMGAALFSMVFIPQVYTPSKKIDITNNTFIDKLAAYDFSKNKPMLISCLVLVIISLFTFNTVGFNNDLQSLNYVPENLKKAESNLDKLSNYSSKTLYVISYGATYDKALEANKDLYNQIKEKQKEHSIVSFSSIGGIIISQNEQERKIEQWNKFWSEEKKEKLEQMLVSKGKKVGFKENTFLPFYQFLNTTFEPLSKDGYKLFNDLFLDEFISSTPNLTGITTVLKTKEQNTQMLVDDISKNNKNVLVIDRKHLQETILGNLEKDFDNLFLISTIVVTLAVFIYFRNVEMTLLTNIPIFIGWFVTLGIMGIFGIQFNAFNIIITTLIFGLGIDYSIFISKSLLEKYTYGKSDLSTYQSGIIMSAVTTILCFGVLIFARHPAIKSIAIIPLIGLLVVVIISFTIQPWLFNLLLFNPQKKGYTPFRLFNCIISVFGFGYFLLSALILNILAFTLFPLIPLKKSEKMKYLQIIFKNIFKSLFFSFPSVKIKTINYQKDLYKKPAIIIANHTSELDTVVLGMLDSRQIFMINERIYNSRFFGKIIRMAGYYPATTNLEKGVETIKERLEQGISVIIFPEGTRSNNSEIHRFHKGAFYLAEQMKVDILPILIHGNSDVMPKKETMVNSGKVTVKFLDKIAYNNTDFGDNYSERAKKINQYFRQEFKKLKLEIEQPDYFKNKLFLNYYYKGQVIQKVVKQEYFSFKETYRKIIEHLSEIGKILHLGGNYGVLDFLIVYSLPKVKITVYEKETEKRQIIENCYSLQRYHIKAVDVIPEEWSAFDTLIYTSESQLTCKQLPANIKIIITKREFFNELKDQKFSIIDEVGDFIILKRE